MPNFEEHIGISALTGLAAYLVAKKQMSNEPVTADEAVGVAILSGVVGTLPDAIEPPTNPKHRKFFHSVSSLGILATANEKMFQKPELTSNQKALLIALSVAYAMHVLTDSTTSSGIPPL